MSTGAFQSPSLKLGLLKRSGLQIATTILPQDINQKCLLFFATSRAGWLGELGCYGAKLLHISVQFFSDQIFTWMALEELPWTRWRKSGGKMLSSIRFS